MNSLIRYVLLTAVRDWLFIGLFMILIFTCFISVFLGSTALSEQAAMQLAFLVASSRMILVIGLVLFICFHIRRSFENREIEFLISRPIGRSTLLFSYFFSFIILSFILLLPIILFIYFFFKPNLAGLSLWGFSIFAELIIISSFAILASLILKSAVSSVLGCFSFYIISRIMGFAVSTIIIPSNLNNINFNVAIEISLKLLSSLLPRLDQFGQSKWLIYGNIDTNMFALIGGQSVIYISLILLMSVIDFNKKQF